MTPPPAADEGVQFYAGAWPLDAGAEDEVCFASYYDFTDQVPAEYQVDCDEFGQGRKCFAFRRNELAQDGQSHHSIINVYTPESDPNGGDWGPWECLGGEKAGQSCDPAAEGACGERSQCATPAITSVACVFYPYAPQDFGAGVGGTSGTQVQLAGAPSDLRCPRHIRDDVRGTFPETRDLHDKACAVYDNGADSPLEVKRESTKPNSPACCFPLAFCGCARSSEPASAAIIRVSPVMAMTRSAARAARATPARFAAA